MDAVTNRRQITDIIVTYPGIRALIPGKLAGLLAIGSRHHIRIVDKIVVGILIRQIAGHDFPPYGF